MPLFFLEKRHDCLGTILGVGSRPKLKLLATLDRYPMGNKPVPLKNVGPRDNAGYGEYYSNEA